MDVWRKYNGAILPTLPPHVEVKSSSYEIKKLIKYKSVYFARWTSDFDSKNITEFWFIINDSQLDIDSYSANTRSKIRRGLKKIDVKIITKNEILINGFDVYKASFDRYRSFTQPDSKDVFQSEITKLDGDREFWGIYLKGSDKLIGYSQNKISHNCCEYDEIRFHPDFLKLYSSYVLFYKMNQFYLNEKNFKYVNDGARSISHNTNIQQFLIEKFKFRKAYCKLHVINLRGLSLVIKLLYPFKGIIQRVNLNFFLKLSVILEQEKIVRSFEKR
jgi:hypothetical protein